MHITDGTVAISTDDLEEGRFSRFDLIDWWDQRKLANARVLVAGDAARFTLSTGLRVEGANYGIASGRAAAEAVIDAGGRKDFSENGLSVYRQHLKTHGIIQDMQQFRHAPHFFKNTHLYKEYPEMICQLGQSLFGVEPGPKKGFGTSLKDALSGRLTKFQVLKDVYGPNNA